jgi:hypothetical protein
MSTTSIRMAADPQRIRKRILDHIHKKGGERAFDHIRDHYNQRGAHQAGGEAMTEAHSSLHTACSMDLT